MDKEVKVSLGCNTVSREQFGCGCAGQLFMAGGESACFVNRREHMNKRWNKIKHEFLLQPVIYRVDIIRMVQLLVKTRHCFWA